MKEFKNNHKNKSTKEEMNLDQESYLQWRDSCINKADENGEFNFQVFFTGFARAAKEAKLSGNALIVYHAICELSWKSTGTMDKPNEYLSEYCGVSGGSLTDSLKQLEDKKFIKRLITKDRYKRTVRVVQLLPVTSSQDTVKANQ
jgi:hypothetical protein